MIFRSVIFLVVYALFCASMITANAAQYTYTTIADSTGAFRVLNVPSINNKGTVAFTATPYIGGHGVFTISGETTTTIADSAGEFSLFFQP